MKQFVSGESDAKGFVGNSSLYCGWSGSRGNPPPGTFGLWHGHAGRGKAWRGLSKAWNMGGHFRKNNKPTQHNGNNTQ